MSSFLHQEQTAHSDVLLGHLEYDYIDQCQDPKELEKIIKVLRSGEEGRYPDLEAFAEKQLTKLNPKSRLLRKEQKVLTRHDLEKSELEEIIGGLDRWSNEMTTVEEGLSGAAVTEDSESKLPPVRGQGSISASNQEPSSSGETKGKSQAKKKPAKPREYREWDKVDVDAELEKIDTGDKKESSKPVKKNVLSKPSTTSIPSSIDSTGMSEQNKAAKAEQEKNKGNEAFRANDFQEALLYYDRSLSLVPSVAVHNNRAQTHIKLKEWDKAIDDCQLVLGKEPSNIKGLLRRSVAYQGKKHYVSAKNDIQRVLEMEPGNKKANSVLQEIEEALAEQKTKGRRMVIEETDGSDESENEEEASKPEPLVNGSHEKQTTKNTPQNTPPKSTSEKVTDQSKENPTEDETKNDTDKSEAETNKVKQKETPVKEKLTDAKTSEEKASLPEKGPSNASKKSKKKKKKSNRNQSGSGAEAPNTVNDEKHTPEVKPEESIPKEKEKTVEKGSAENESPAEPKDSAPEAVNETESKSTPVKEEEPPAPDPPTPLPDRISAMKAEGNDLFKKGQYAEAVGHYTKAIDALSKEKGNHVNNLHLLYGNRGLCKLKVGDSEGCVRDCNTALDLQPASIKPLARRAQAFESMEKFRRAYVDYRQVLYMDRSVDVAQQGLNRCMKMLQQMDGPKWREKLPDVKVAHLTQSSNSISSTSPVQKSTTSVETRSHEKASSHTAEQPKVPELTKEQQYDKHKAEGNAFVQKGEFAAAVPCYTSCIEISPEKSVAYINRALCYLRLNKVKEVLKDCNEGLRLEPGNIKALFRRAQAYKMLEQYDESYHDLTTLLKKDSKNSSARRELLVVMKYRDQAMKAKAKKQKDDEEKKRHRMKIQEVSDSDSTDEDDIEPTEIEKTHSPDKGSKVKDSPKSKPENVPQKGSKSAKGKQKETPKEKSVKVETKSEKKAPTMPEPHKEEKVSKKIEEIKEDSPSQEDKSTKKSVKSVNKPSNDKKKTVDASSKKDETEKAGEKSSPKITLTNATAYEFIKAWTGLRGKKEVDPYAHLLDQLNPDDLPKVISNKLDGDMLHMLIRCVEIFIDKGQLSRSLAYLQNLVKVPRFNMVTMFMGTKEKSDLERVFGKLSDGATCPILQEDLKKLRESYEM